MAGFSGFPEEGMQFLKGLKKNNRREWFQQRKALFDESVKAPMEQLVEALSWRVGGRRVQIQQGRFVALDRHLQSRQHTLGSEVVDDDPLGDLDRLIGHTHRLAIEAEIDDQFFRGAGDAAEIRVEADRAALIDLELRNILLGGGSSGGCRSWIFFLVSAHEKTSLGLKKGDVDHNITDRQSAGTGRANLERKKALPIGYILKWKVWVK